MNLYAKPDGLKDKDSILTNSTTTDLRTDEHSHVKNIISNNSSVLIFFMH